MLALLTVGVTLFLLQIAAGNLRRVDPVPWVQRAFRINAALAIVLVLGGAAVGGWSWGWLSAAAGFALSLPLSRLVVRSIRPGVAAEGLKDSTPHWLSFDRFLEEMSPSQVGVWGISWWRGASRALEELNVRLGRDSLAQVSRTVKGTNVKTRFTEVADSVAHVDADLDDKGLVRISFEVSFPPPDLDTRMHLRFGQEAEGMTYEDSDDFETYWECDGFWVALEAEGKARRICFGRFVPDGQ